MQTAPARAALVAIALGLAGAGPAFAQLSRDQQACIGALNGGLLKVAQAQGKEANRCAQLGAKGKLAGSVEACLTADVRGKVAKAEQKTLSLEGRKCGAPPAFGPGDGAIVNIAGREASLDALHDLLGADADAAVLPAGADKAGARCQKALLKAAYACLFAKLADFNACKKAGTKSGTVASAADLESCLGQDLRGKVAKACDDAGRPDKLRSALGRKCLAKGAELAAAAPPCGVAGDAEATHACLEPRIECRACRAVNRADGLAVDCDLFDDGLVNASCVDDEVPPPGENDVHLPAVFVEGALPNGGLAGTPRGPAPSGFQSYIQVQNLESAATNVTVTYYHADGSVAATDTVSVPGDGVGRLSPGSAAPLPSGFVGGARFSSPNAIAVAATLEGFEGGFRGAAYRGLAAGEASSTLILPSVGCNRAGFSTTFYVQNTGSSAATLNLEYIASEAGQGLSVPRTIPAAGVVAGVECGVLEGVAGTFDGYAILTSDQPLVATAFDFNAAVGGSLLAYDAVPGSSSAILAPLVRSDFGGAFTGLAIQNVGSSATSVSVAYGANQVPGGNPAAPAGTTIPGLARITLTPTVTGSYQGAAEITQGSGAPSLVAVVDEVDTGNPARRSAYAGLDAAGVGTDLAVPIVFANANDFSSSVTCQATQPGTGITLHFTENTEEPGELPAPEAATLATAGDSVTFVQGGGQWDAIGRYVGAARVASTEDVACVARIDGPPTLGDSSYLYLPLILKN